MNKPWYTSRTIWFNIIVLALAAAELQLNVIKGMLPGGLYAWLAFGLPISNVALRFISSKASTESKPWYTSKTIWFNIIVLSLAAAELQLNTIKDMLPGGLYAWLAFGLPIANAALRFISSTALTASTQTVDAS